MYIHMCNLDMSQVTRKSASYTYEKTKMQISCAAVEQLTSAFVFTLGIVKFLDFLNLQFQASNLLLLLIELILYRSVCV